MAKAKPKIVDNDSGENKEVTRNAFYSVFLEQLADMLNGEKQLIECYPKLIENVSTPELKLAFENHLEETRLQVSRLNEIFKIIDQNPPKVVCNAMEGLIIDCQEFLKKPLQKLVMDAALVSTVQRIEHYEIAAYTTLIAFADQFSLNDIIALLHESLTEESNADKTLKKLSKGTLFKRGLFKLAKEEVI